jgi:hypothetical protein
MADEEDKVRSVSIGGASSPDERAAEVAQRIAEIHPPVGLRLVTDTPSGQNYATGAWQADRCPEWIAEIKALIAAHDAEIVATHARRLEEMRQALKHVRYKSMMIALSTVEAGEEREFIEWVQQEAKHIEKECAVAALLAPERPR